MVIEEVAAPAIGPHDVLVHIDASGVCHSDLSFANGNVPLPPPVILGHEGAGTVLAVGSDVVRVRWATVSSRRSRPRAATASSACATSRSCARRWART